MLGEAMIITNFIQMAKLYMTQLAQEYTLPVLCSLRTSIQGNTPWAFLN